MNNPFGCIQICTLYFGAKKFGTICALPSNLGFVILDGLNAQKIDLSIIDGKTVDEPLRKLSSVDYMIIYDKAVIYKDKVYEARIPLPVQVQFQAIPHVRELDIVDYESPNIDIDGAFLGEGYARELKDAKYIMVPPDWDDVCTSCTPADLLIRKKEPGENGKNIYTSFSGRKTENANIAKANDRYLFLAKMPKFTGDMLNSPITFTIGSIGAKWATLQDRLQNYGRDKVQSLCASMRSIPQRLPNVKNQFQASNIYDDMSAILDKVRDME